jgi:hypothetical protein
MTRKDTTIDEPEPNRAAHAARGDRTRVADEIMAISKRCATLRRKTRHTAEAIIGYDERGLPR